MTAVRAARDVLDHFVQQDDPFIYVPGTAYDRADAIIAALTAAGYQITQVRADDGVRVALCPGQPGTRYRHRKSGGEYTLNLIGQLQCDEPMKDYDRIVVYTNDKDDMTWARPPHEFFDGRFDRIEDATHDKRSSQELAP